MLATPLPSPVVLDYFETTLASACGAGADVTATLTAIVNSENTPVQIPTTGYAVISPSSTTGLKEVVLYDTLNVGEKTVRLHERGLTTVSGTLDQSHSAGETFAIPITANYLNDVVKLIQDVTVGHTHDGTDAKKVSLAAPNAIGTTTPNAGTFTAIVTNTIVASGTALFHGGLSVTAQNAYVSEGLALSLTPSGPILDPSYLMLSGKTQTTVGAAGAASALPGAPLGYLISWLGLTKIVTPYWLSV